MDLSLKERLFGAASTVAMSIGAIAVHENCHKYAALALFKDVDPYIDCDFSRFPSICYANMNGPMRENTILDYLLSKGIVYAAGPLSDITLVALASIIAWKMQHRNKEISKVFVKTAFGIAFNTFVYAIMSQSSKLSVFLYFNSDFAKIEHYLDIPRYVQMAIISSVFLGTLVLDHKIYEEKKELKSPAENEQK
jgi:riboflavin transporter FmnP